MTFRGVLFDWRGTLVVAPTVEEWATEALRRLGRSSGAEAVDKIAPLLVQVADDLDAPGLDADATLHLSTYQRVLAGLGFEPKSLWRSTRSSPTRRAIPSPTTRRRL
ncbi:MAG: hypothetical protein M3P89_11065 [Actinomycetota bacterium]|nr:hypothetical protein [Actinomycetota bacterium]